MLQYEIQYHEDVLHKDISKLSKSALVQIRKAVVSKLQTKPNVFGKPLRNSLRRYFKLRVANYRIVFKIKKKNVFVLAVRHRKDIYQIANNRLR